MVFDTNEQTSFLWCFYFQKTTLKLKATKVEFKVMPNFLAAFLCYMCVCVFVEIGLRYNFFVKHSRMFEQSLNQNRRCFGNQQKQAKFSFHNNIVAFA